MTLQLAVHDESGREKETRACRTVEQQQESLRPAEHAKASRLRIAVTNHAQTVSGMRISVIPGARMSIVVEMKLSEPSSDATQKIRMLTIQIVWPDSFAGAGDFAEAAERRIGRPAADRRAAGNHERGEHAEETRRA